MRLVEEIGSGAGGEHVRLLDVPAAAYAEAGRFDDACRAATTGLAAAASDGVWDTERLRARLVLYRRGKPYREESGVGTEAAVSEIPADAS